MDYGSDIKTSFALLVHNEDDELKQLLDQLLSIKTIWDEIVIVGDSKENPKTMEILEFAKSNGCRVMYHEFTNFSDQKNYLISQCKNEYIFNLDADELLSNKLAESFREILFLNPNVEYYKLPRVNTVKGITLEYIYKWKWIITRIDSEIEEKVLDKQSDEYILYKTFGLIIQEQPENNTLVRFFTPIINFPDLQGRLHKNLPNIKWIKPVHEVMVGYKNYASFPLHLDYSILHHKKMERQILQNDSYDKMTVK